MTSSSFGQNIKEKEILRVLSVQLGKDFHEWENTTRMVKFYSSRLMLLKQLVPLGWTLLVTGKLQGTNKWKGCSDHQDGKEV